MTNTLNVHALALKEADTLTIDTGVVTATQEYHVIAAESGTTDTLDTINLGYTNLSVKGNTYRPCIRLIADSGDTITLSHGTGNLTLPGGSNITLSDDAFVWLLWRGSAWYALGTVGSAGSVTSNDVTMDVLDTPTYTTLQDWSDTTQSAGLISGGAITDNLDGTCAVASGTGIIKATDSNVGNNLFFDFDADASVTLTDESDNWVYVDYNAGTPIIDAAVDWTTLDLHTQIIVGKVYREGTELHIVPAAQYIDDFSRRVMQRFWEVEMVKRASGLILADAGTLHFEFTAGILYAALGRLTISAFDTTGADRFTYMYRDGGGGWTEVAAQAVIDNAYWDDGTGVLNTLTALRYGVHWVYVGHDGDVYVQYGQGDYTLSQALAALVPTPPPELTAIATLVGKIIAQQGGTELYSAESAFRQTFEGTTATDHGSLAGLADDDHAQYVLLAGRAGDKIVMADSATTAPLSATERSAAPSSPATGDIYLDDGTNTTSGLPGWRRYTGAAWEDISAGGGGALSEACIEDHKAQNTSGGTFTQGAWRTRDLNTKVYDPDMICSIEKLAFTSGGTYEVQIGDTITGATSGTTATVWDVELASGTWAGGDAAGNLWLEDDASGAFVSENLNVGAESNVATIAADATNNQVRLKAGTYRFHASAPAEGVGQHQARIENTSDTATVNPAESRYNAIGAAYAVSTSDAKGRTTIAAAKTFELQHKCQSTLATYGFGFPANQTTEVYSRMTIIKE